MNWTWSIRTRDGGMNGLEFSRCTTAGGFRRALIHAAPARASIEVTTDAGELVARGDVDRDGRYSPMTLIELQEGAVRRSEIWPNEEHYGLPVLLAGGEAGLLTAWENAEDHSWWRWSLELSNHKGRPEDWAPPGQSAQH
jgi:hypothetical protein